MPRLTRNVQHRSGVGWGWTAAFALSSAFTVSTAVHAQNRPPLPNEPVAMEGTTKQFYRGLNLVVVKTKEGGEYVYNLIVHGGKKPGVDALEGLREGTTVAIHYSTTGGTASAREIDVGGDQVLRITEGAVTDIDRGKKQITIRFTNGQTETLEMTTRDAESEAINDARKPSGRIVVYYADEEGRKVAHYFKRAS
jgi:hypothetical protein